MVPVGAMLSGEVQDAPSHRFAAQQAGRYWALGLGRPNERHEDMTGDHRVSPGGSVGGQDKDSKPASGWVGEDWDPAAPFTSGKVPAEATNPKPRFVCGSRWFCFHTPRLCLNF